MGPFTYETATSAADAVARLGRAGSGATFLAGGTTLYDLMKLNVARPTAVVDVTRIDGFDTIEVTPGEIVIGAGARMADVAEHRVLRQRFPALAESLALAASQQLRTMATVGGNLLQRTRCAYFRGGVPFSCNKREPGSGCSALAGSDREHAVLGTSEACIATYPGDWAVALVAFDATVDVVGAGGARTVDVATLHREPADRPDLDHVLAPDELIVAIRVPHADAGRASTYRKIRDRESYAFALASAAVGLDLAADGTVRDARIALGGVATRPWRARAAEQVLQGATVTPESARAAGEAALAGARPGRENGFKVELAVRTVADAVLVAAGRSGS